MTCHLFTIKRGDCAGHPCDLCPTCRAGRCCRRDRPGYSLPALGSWDGRIYGTLGVLRVDDDTATCHACGEDFVYLAVHVWWKHDLTAREYKAIFGLKAKQPLCALWLVRQKHARGLINTNGIAAIKAHRGMRDWTPEQRSAAASAGQMVAPQWVAELQAKYPGQKPCADCGTLATGSRRRDWRCIACWQRVKDGAA